MVLHPLQIEFFRNLLRQEAEPKETLGSPFLRCTIAAMRKGYAPRVSTSVTRRRLHTSTRKTLLSYYSEEEAAEIIEAAKKLRMSISNFIASAALKEANVVNSKPRKSH
ncbi:hypothetical protein SBA1_1180001 [Candidatus Sulfotelmatobacter kueseliae]|uniref:Uncharacterized protein n=1 Tax=Candidatus Sulfotelmatobacter kueseliae TaxID=2042962 RepID=A0A2U3K196_9BACT|nr:hypothetical protein SBA1_1180001 [Candidatus Sulfotelmatobacter kueseliae]